MKYNIWNKWDKLKVVMLGNCYPLEFYRDIKDIQLRDSLLKITEETLEDLDYYEKVLKDFGCTVLRCPMNPKDNILNYMDNEGKLEFGSAFVRGVEYEGHNYGIGTTLQGIPRSPLQPRDNQMVLGNDFVFVNWREHPSVLIALKKYCNEYSTINVMLTEEHYQTNLSTLQAPCITSVGKDLYVEGIILDNTDIRKYWNGRINEVHLRGHSDGVFHTIKEGAILSKVKPETYSESFPGWEICRVAPDLNKKNIDFYRNKWDNQGKYWVPESVDNDSFRNFVNSWLVDWIGDSSETAFDVNVLVLDEHHVCVSNDKNDHVNAFLKKHKMEPVHIPWRHRLFWDGGLHCITLDLYREGTQQDYFPERKHPVILKNN